MARKERDRLKLQDKLRKEQLAKMRETLNTDAAAGEVRRSPPCPGCRRRAGRAVARSSRPRATRAPPPRAGRAACD